MAAPEKGRPQWNSTLRRKTPLRTVRSASFTERSKTESTKASKPSRKGLGPGKKTKAWDAVRRKLKVAFQRVGITICEARGPGCWVSNGLGFAHSLKRRFIVTSEQMEECALLCSVCHDAWETGPHDVMEAAIKRIISERAVPVEKIF